MSRSFLLRLDDMLEAMERIQAVVARIGEFDKFKNDRDSQMILERGFEIVSEASRHLPTDLKQRHPQVPWKDIKNFGNILRHEYDRTSQQILWDTAREDVPGLIKICKSELDREQQRENPLLAEARRLIAERTPEKSQPEHEHDPGRTRKR